MWTVIPSNSVTTPLPRRERYRGGSIIFILMLGMAMLMPSISFAHDPVTSAVMNRVWDYHLQLRQDVGGMECNMYMSYTVKANRRNVLLRYFPSMKSISRGDREFVGEAYGRLRFHDLYTHDFVTQVKNSTIPRHRKPVAPLFDNMVPCIYGEHFYQDRLLSPFHRKNKRFYTYNVTQTSDSTARVDFKPRVKNTQLVNGHAFVSTTTGFIHSVEFRGEFDMLHFTTTVEMKPNNLYGLPKSRCTKARLKCLFNDIEAEFNYFYDTPQTVPDSIKNVVSPQMMDSLRYIPITHRQDSIYQSFKHRQDSISRVRAAADSVASKRPWYEGVRHVAWDELKDSASTGTGKAYVGATPLLNPAYMSYSSSKGVSFKMNVNATYKWNEQCHLNLKPRIGYYTKKKQFYYTVPLTLTYHPKRNGKAGFIWANGNRITNAKMEETFSNRVGGDSIKMPDFRDQRFTLYNDIHVFNWVQLTTGLNYHIRSARGKHELFRQAGLKTTYRSFSPYVTIHLLPWQERGPVLSANYEQSILNVMKSDLNYSRYEFDAQYKHKMRGMRLLNLRVGSGFYTLRNTDYFVDYNNFYDNNLPTGWNDDWTGQFQLVSSRCYNESNYYIRTHISYESPLLALSWIPLIGRFIESERLYFSALNIEHYHDYFELGYGLKCKYFSAALFASFLKQKFDALECKFTFEPFNRW